MTFKRLILAALFVAMLALPASASSSTVYRYAKCSAKYDCSWAAFVKPAHTRVNMIVINSKCSKKGSTMSGSLPKKVKINSKRKFKATLKVMSYDTGNYKSFEGTAKVTGTVSKRKKIKLKYSIDTVSPGCAKNAKGKATLKFKEVNSGGG